jgi:hypothetical protein
MKAHPECEAEPRDWIRRHLATGHESRCTRSTVLHRLYVAQPEIKASEAITLIESGGPVSTGIAVYQKGE